MEKLKEFFSPVRVGSEYRTWWSYYLTMQNAGLQTIWIIITILIGTFMSPEFFEPGEGFWYYILFGGSICITIIVALVSLIYWKNIRR